MASLLPKTVNRRKTKIVVTLAELYRPRGVATWKLRLRCGGKPRIYETGTSIESAARLFAVGMVREIMRIDFDPGRAIQPPPSSKP